MQMLPNPRLLDRSIASKRASKARRGRPQRPRWRRREWLTCEHLEPRLVLDSTVVFNEIMYHPADANAPEWIELYNQNSVNMDLSGWSLTDGVQYTFPEGTVLDGGSYLVITSDPEALQSATGVTGALGPFTGRLANGGEQIELRSNNGRLMNVLDYNDRTPWPVGPDGSGVTLAKRNEHTATEVAENWTFSPQIGGTPGVANFVEPGTMVFQNLLVEASPVRATVPVSGELGLGWTEPGFDDASWTEGTTGVGLETRTGYERLLGLDINNPPNGQPPLPRNQSVYIRVPFSGVADLDRFDTLLLRMKYDDGFVAYINGVEVAHDNAPGRDGDTRPLNWFSGATGSHSDRAAVEFVDFDITPYRDLLAEGENVLAIHGLNRSPNDDDLLLLPVIAAGREVKPDAGTSLALSEIGPVGPDFWLEMTNTGNEPIDAAGITLRVTGASGGDHVLDSQTVPAGGFLTVSAQELGFQPNAGERLFLYDRTGQLLDAQEIPDRLVGRSERFDGRWMFPATATPGVANQFQFIEDVVINEILYHAPPQYAEPDTPATYDLSTLMPFDSVWRYNQSREALAPNWYETTYDVDNATWYEGRGPLGFDSDQLPEPLNTTLNDPTDSRSPFVTYYFQTEFDLSGDEPLDVLQLTHLIKDGAIFYLNGVEVLRHNMPSGFVSALSKADQRVRSAEKIGPVTIPKSLLRTGRNVLSVEVHLSSTFDDDVVFGMELLAGREVTPGIPGVPFAPSDEEWIELYNRNQTVAVDLSGWQLEEAIGFTFPEGSVLGPGQYLVVAKDPRAVEAKHPEVLPAGAVLGPYDRTLADDDERVVLLDAHGNIADEVHYYDGGRWHDNADGGGSSLELRDPMADNRRPEAWAPSDESGVLGRSAWQHYSYTRTVEPLVFDPPINFHEFHMGMLDAGEVLLDNISVIEDPGGANIELLQNGDFQSDTVGDRADKWRIQGSHEDSRVAADPDDPTNQVLHLIAEARTNYFGNHAETTLANGAEVHNGTTYQISFDARWIAGSPQLHTELYYKDAARTTIVQTPDRTGTPGARNSTFEANIGPTYDQFQHRPLIPKATQSVTVTVTPQDPDGVASADLMWRVNAGDFATTPMALQTDGSYSATIPRQPDNSVVQFYVRATDSRQAVSTYPADGPESRALFKVDDDFELDPLRHDFRIIMLPDEANNLHAQTEYIDNDRTGSTIIYRGKEAFYDVGTRLKGSMFSRNDVSRAGFNIRFHPDQRFRGVHDKVTIDRANKQEIQVKHMIQRAGMYGGMYDDVVDVRTPRGSGDGPSPLQMARHESIYLDEQFENGSDGTVYKFEGIRVMTNTVNSRDPESLKIYQPIGWVSSFDITDLGDGKELYRWPFLITNNRAKDDFSRMIDMAKAFSLEGSQLQDAVAEVLDIDQWMRAFAMMSLAGIGDVYSQGNPHNLSFYQRPSDNKMLVFPWDWDFTFSQSATAALHGGKNIGKIINLPVYERLFLGHMLDLINTTFNVDYMSDWLDHYGRMLNMSFTSNQNYIRQRSEFVLGRLPEKVPFDITTQDIDTTRSRFTIQGNGWIDVREIRIAGDDHPLPVQWTGVDTWQIDMPLEPGTNTIQFEAYDSQRTLIGTDQVVIQSEPDAVLGDVIVSEVHYHNVLLPDRSREEPESFEFIELYNRSGAPVDLAQWRLSGDVQFVFAEGTTVGSGETVVVFPFASNDLVKVFSVEVLYGVASSALNMVGPYVGALNHEGGSLRLERPLTADPGGPADYALADEVVYDNDAPYPPLAGGHGESLSRQPLLRFGVTGSVWAADTPSPGSADLVLRAVGDVTGDGRFDSLDLTSILQSGKYLSNVPATWNEGDFNGDGVFDERDIVFALQEGDFS